MGEPGVSCDGLCDTVGKCDPAHPIHCCHFVVAVRRGNMKGYGCLKCKEKFSKVWVKVKSETDQEPTI